MRIRSAVRFDVTPAEGAAMQRRLAARLARAPSPGLRLRRGDLVAGADAAYHKPASLAFGAVVVCRYPDMEPVEIVTRMREVSFPYVPGLLSFREAPVLLDCFRAIRTRVRAVIVDGAGAAHPRGFGLACHVGWALDLPSAGCAKSILCGEHPPVPEEAGGRAPIVFRGELIGEALRTRARVRPVYASVGWKISLAAAVGLVAATTNRYRLPEPTRLADIEVSRAKREWLAG